jgi:hypothetical protein
LLFEEDFFVVVIQTIETQILQYTILFLVIKCVYHRRFYGYTPQVVLSVIKLLLPAGNPFSKNWRESRMTSSEIDPRSMYMEPASDTGDTVIFLHIRVQYPELHKFYIGCLKVIGRNFPHEAGPAC